MKLCKLILIGGVAIATAVFPAMAQQAQRPTTEDHSAHHGGADQQAGQPSQGGVKKMGDMMGHGMMGGGSPMMGGMTGQGMTGCPWCGPGMMGWGYATPQPSINLSVNDVKSFLDRWVAGNPNIKVANVVEQDNNMIAAGIATRDKDGLAQRYSFGRWAGFYRRVQ